MSRCKSHLTAYSGKETSWVLCLCFLLGCLLLPCCLLLRHRSPTCTVAVPGQLPRLRPACTFLPWGLPVLSEWERRGRDAGPWRALLPSADPDSSGQWGREDWPVWPDTYCGDGLSSLVKWILPSALIKDIFYQLTQWIQWGRFRTTESHVQ